MEEISRAALNVPEIGDIRGRGLAIGVELVRKGIGDPDADLTRKTVYRAWQLGAVFWAPRFIDHLRAQRACFGALGHWPHRI